MPNQETKLSKMQKIRKRELRRAIQRLHEIRRNVKASFANSTAAYGLSVAITILGEMRKEIDTERDTDSKEK